MFIKYIKPTGEITRKANEYYNEKMIGNNWIGVHVRGSDKVLESPHLEFTNTMYTQYIDKIIELNPAIKIFLMTDTNYVVEEYVQRYGERVLCTPSTRTDSQTGVHINSTDGVQIGKEVYLDSLLAIKCDYFVGNQESNVSLAISSMKEWPNGQIIMLGVSSARNDNFFIHKRTDSTLTNCSICAMPLDTSNIMVNSSQMQSVACTHCDSLQIHNESIKHSELWGSTEKGDHSLIMRNFLYLPRFLEILDIKRDDRCLDYSRDQGMFTDLMRNLGYNYYYFSSDNRESLKNRSVKLVTLFNEIEMFTNPQETWKALFEMAPSCIVGTTDLIPKEHPHFSAANGVTKYRESRYSPETLSYIAVKHGYCAYILGPYFLLSRSPLSEEAGKELSSWFGSLENQSVSVIKNWMNNYLVSNQKDAKKQALRVLLRQNNARIALEGYFFRFSTGITRLWTSLLAEWSLNGFGEFITVLDRDNTAPCFGGISYRTIPQHNYGALAQDHELLQKTCDEEGITLFTSTYYTTPVTTPAVILVPDMIPEVMNFDLSNPQWTEKHNTIRYANKFLSISQSTSIDLMKYFPDISQDRIVTSYCGTEFRTPSSEKIVAFKERYGITKPYFMISGVKTDYKNAILCFKAFQQLGERRKDFAIVCTNSMPTLEPEFAECIGEGSSHLLILSDEELQCAYAGAIALAFPSRYEGFGLPVLEAMACSCPVITCRTSSIPEVGGDAVIYVSPDSVDEMCNAMIDVQVPEIRNSLISKGLIQSQAFSWRNMADTIENMLAETCVEIILNKKS